MSAEQVPEGTLSRPVFLGSSEGRTEPWASRASHAHVLAVWVEAPCGWINSNHRLHRMASAKLTKLWRLAAAEAIPAGIAQFEAPVRIVAHIWKPRRGRFDPNNLAPTTKACTDGFVDSGVLFDDSWDRVEGPDHRYGGKGPAGIVFTFEAV